MAAALPRGASLAEEAPLLPRGASLAEPVALPRGASLATDADTILAEMERKEQARRQVARGVKAETPEGEHDPRAATMALAQHIRTGYTEEAPPLEIQQLASGELPGSYAGVKTPAMRGVDILDMLTSPVARPLVFSPAAVAADFDALEKMEPGARREWVTRLSPEDERRPIFEEAVLRLDEGKGVGAGLKARLWKTYESAYSPLKKTSAADIDPYGGTGLPHPWQEVDELGRPVQGAIPADPTDILLRGILAGGTWTGPGDPLADPARYMEMRREIQRGGASVTALLKDLLPAGAGAGVLAASPLAGAGAVAAAPVAGLLGLTGMAVGGVRATKRVLREGAVPEEAEAAIAAGDTRTGLVVPELAAMIGPDLITKATPVGLAVGAARTGALRTGAGLLTKAGDELLQAQRATAHGPLVERFRTWWRSEAAAGRPPAESAPGVPAPEPTAEALSSLSRRIHEAVDSQFTRVGDEAAAQRKVVERIDLGKAIRLDVENLGADGLPRVQVDAGKVDVTYGAKRAPGGIEAWLGGQTPGLFGRRSLLGVSIEGGGRGLSRLSIGATEEGPRYVFAGPLERSRRLLGTGQPWAVEVAPGRFEPVKPSAILGDHRWQALQQALAKARYGRNADKHAVDEAAFAVLWGMANRRQQQIATRYLEAMGDASLDGDLAARLMARLEQEMAGVARMVPEEWIAEQYATGVRRTQEAHAAVRAAEAEVGAARQAMARAGGRVPTAEGVALDELAAARKAERRARREAATVQRQAADIGSAEQRELDAIQAEMGRESARLEEAQARFNRAVGQIRMLTSRAGAKQDELDALRAEMRAIPGFIEEIARRFREGSGGGVPDAPALWAAAIREERAADDDLARLQRRGEDLRGAQQRAAAAAARRRRMEALARGKQTKPIEVRLAQEDIAWADALMREGEKRVSTLLDLEMLPEGVRAADAAEARMRAARTPGAFDISDEQLGLALDLLDADGVAYLLREGVTLAHLADALEALAARSPRLWRRAFKADLDTLKESLRAELSEGRAAARIVVGAPPGKATGLMAQRMAEAAQRFAGGKGERAERMADALDDVARRFGRAWDEERRAREAATGAEERLASARAYAQDADDSMGLLGRMSDAATMRAADPGLYDPILGVLRSETSRAQILRGLMEDLTGFATAAQREEMLRVIDRMDQVIHEANLHLSDRAFREAIETMTVAQAKQAERAVARAGGPEAAKAEWAALPDNVKAAIGTARRFFDDMYLRLKAEGILPAGWSRAEFMERMRVEGYVSHMLRRGGGVRGAFRQWRLAQRFGVDFGALKQRKYAGTAEEINESVRRDIAMMIREHELAKATGVSNYEARLMARTAPALAAPADPVRALLVSDVEAAGVARTAEEHAARTRAAIDADLDRIVAEYDLGRIQFFETDAYRLMIDYGQGAAAALANKRFIDHLRAIFPEGDLARLSPEGRLPLAGTTGLDVQAELAGWRRLNGSAQVEAVFADLIPWKGWRQYRSEIDAIVKNAPEAERERELDKVLRKMGADTSGRLATAVRHIVKQDVFLPAQVVETIEYFARPDPVKAFSKMAQIPLTVADDMLAFFKTGVTVGAVAFHGRNAISNALTSLMVAGPRALSPVIHAQVVGLLSAVDATKPYTMRVAGQDVTQTVGQWRDELARLGVLSYHVTLADVTKTLDQHRVRTGTGVKVAALGAAAGFAAGYSEGKTPQEKVRKGFQYAYVGGLTGGVGFGVHEVFFRRGFRAAGQQATGKADPKFFSSDTWASVWEHRGEAFRAGATAIIEDATQWAKVRPALSAGGVFAAAAGVADVMGGAGAAAATATAVKGFLAAFAVKYGGEGFFLLGGGVGQAIESQWRAANYFAGRSAGMSPEAAADLVNRALFDYDDLTPFERHGIRRVFPFWTWNSRNALRLQPWLMTNRPHVYQALDKILILATNPDPSEGDMSLLPPEQRWRFVVNTGAGRIIAGFGLPHEALIQQFRTEGLEPTALTAQLRPEVQFIEKFLVGRHPYYDVDLRQIRTARDARYLPPFVQRWLGYDERIDTKTGRIFHQTGHFPERRGRGKQGDPYFIPSGEDPRLGAYRMALLQSFPAWRIAVEYNKAAAETFMRGTGEGEVGPPVTSLERTFALATGVKPYGVDWDELELQMWRRFERNLMTSAEAQDLAKRFPYFAKQRDIALRDYEVLTGQGE